MQLSPVTLSGTPENPATVLPRRPRTLEETGLTLSMISELTNRLLYINGELTGQQIVNELCLPYEGVLDQAIAYLRREQLVEVKGSGGVGEKSYRYQITMKGAERARELLARNQYVGPAPVTLNDYTAVMARQGVRGLVIDEDSIRRAFAHLVIGESLFQQLGPAINSGRSIFLYGNAGTGKTSIAEAIAQLLSQYIAIPHALIFDNQIIKVFDPIHHQQAEMSDEQRFASDQRWVYSRRPIVEAGGELAMESLDLVYDPDSKYYESPLQLKANGGLFLIDDFGRQAMRPRELLNRWIVPLEKRVDYLTLHTGKKIKVPFDELIIFSTNIEPRQLVDEAFLRRIPYKIEVPNPTPAEYREILRRVCKAHNLTYSDDALRYLLEQEYRPRNLDLRACHPRDLVNQLIDIAHFTRQSPLLSAELLRAACKSYFVEM